MFVTNKILVENILKICIAVISVILVLVVLSSVIYFFGYFSLEKESETPIKTQNDMTTEEKVQEVFSGLEDLRNISASAEDRLAYLEEQERELRTEELSAEQDAILKVYIADLKSEQNPDEALTSFFDLYTNKKYENVDWLQVRVLTEVMLFATEVGSSRLSFDDAKSYIFAPDRFGPVVGINTYDNLEKINDVEDAKRLAALGLDVAANKMFPGIKKLRLLVESDVMLSSFILSSLFEAASTTQFTAPIAQQQIIDSPDIALEFEKLRTGIDEVYFLARKEAQNTEGYSADIVYIFNFTQKVYTGLLFVGQDTLKEIEGARRYLSAYIARHGDESGFSKSRSDLIQASSDMLYACALTIEHGPFVDEDTAKEIRKNIGSMLALPKEQIQEHGAPIAAVSKNPHYACYEAFIQIGNEIEPAFKEFLVNDVGGWKYEQF